MVQEDIGVLITAAGCCVHGMDKVQSVIRHVTLFLSHPYQVVVMLCKGLIELLSRHVVPPGVWPEGQCNKKYTH